MNTSISPEQAAFLDQQVAVGAFANPQEAVAAAIDLLRRRADALTRIDSGRRQLDEGDFTEYDEASLRSRFEELKQCVRDLRRGMSKYRLALSRRRARIDYTVGL